MDNTFPFQIFPSSGVPIYRQVMEQVERLIAAGRLKPGDRLPSVRQIAEELEVNPMTVSKAYMLLENQGVLERLRGQGMIVAKHQTINLSLEQRLKRLESVASQLMTLAHQLHLSQKQVVTYLTSVLKGLGND